MSSGTNFASTSPAAGSSSGGTLSVTLPEINFDSPDLSGGALPGSGSYGDPIEGFQQINRQMADTQRAFSDSTARVSNDLNAQAMAQNAARNAGQRAQLDKTAQISQALRAPLNQPPVTGPMLPPNFAETEQAPTLPDFTFAAPTPPSDAGGGTRPETASVQAATTSPAVPPALPPLVPNGAAAFADNVQRFAGAAAGRTIPVVSALNQIFASEPALAPGLNPEQEALVGRRLLDATPLAGQAVAVRRPILAEGFTAPPAGIGTPPTALAPVPGIVAGPLPGFTAAAPEPGLEGLTLPPAFGPLPGLTAAPPLGVTLPGLMPAGQTPPLPGFDAADPALTGAQVAASQADSDALRRAAAAAGARILPNGTAIYAKRVFDPSQAGGTITPMDYRRATITPVGVESVRQHLTRFGSVPANDAMVNRLEQITSGNLDASEYDLRFYTHELRELERYRALGVADGQNPDGVWNNAHTATLADYGLEDFDASRNYVLYHPDTWESLNN